MIKHEKGKWVLYSKDGSKQLGEYDTEQEAKDREKEIIAAKEAKKAMVEMSLTITKATLGKDGVMRWQAVASTTDLDQRNEQTTLALFEDWIERATTGKSVDYLPPPRMPFLGLSHYSDLDGFGEAGITEKMYIDGNRFKVSGVFNDNPLGKALFEAVASEREMIQKGETVERPIRISAGWWDITHKHGDFVFERKSLDHHCPMCMKGMPREFLKGQPDHWAGTRVPVNKATSIGLEEKSMATKKEDAASIVSPELAEELDKKEKGRLTKKSEVEEQPALVVKADEQPAKVERMFGGATTMQQAEEFQMAQEKANQVWSYFDTFMFVVDNIMYEDDVMNKAALISQAVKDFGDRVAALKANLSDAVMLQPTVKGEIIMSDEQKPDVLQTAIETGLQATSREEAFKVIQPVLEEYVNTIKAQVDAKFPPDPTEQVTKAINDAFGPITEQLGLIVAKLNQQPAQAPVQKSLMPGQVHLAGHSNEMPVSPITGKPSALTAMIRKSVGV